ncbi:MAG: c-type cytochrome [Gammaproteobacteria bacterium]|nr:c-type cytochrome [Gammaproteobacteria bacterium]
MYLLEVVFHSVARLTFVGLLALVIGACAEPPTSGGGGRGSGKFSQTKFEDADQERGARLYDNWWKEKGEAPPKEEVFELWEKRTSEEVQQIDKSSFRCVTCHGWDYKGFEGAASQFNDPESYTGFPGLLQLATDPESGMPREAEEVFNFIKSGEALHYDNTPHEFKELNNKDLHDLTRFVIDVGFKTMGSPLAGGNSQQGQTKFLMPNPTTQRSCIDADCHSTPDMRQRIISKAEEDPEFFLHKVRFGQPGGPMPGGVDILDARDILAYLKNGASEEPQTGNFSEVKLQAASLSNGGLLYDKWWDASVKTTAAPEGTHPLWPTETNTKVTGSRTWRCKQCHGWDYRGKDGAYKDGLNFSDIKGVIGTTNTPTLFSNAGEVYNYISTNVDHAFNQLFDEAEYYDLTLFIMTMREEASQGAGHYQFIDDAKKTVLKDRSNPEEGNALYHGNAKCSLCHGLDGKQIDFGNNEFLGEVAADNPWEFVHKTRFGAKNESGNSMPGLVDNIQDPTLRESKAAIDILAYVQENFVSSMPKAGRLYDNWIVEADAVGVPNTTHPIWEASGNTVKTGETTWRCKSCHGWDYLGKNGAYATGEYQTNIKGVLGSVLDPTTMFNFIKNGDASWPEHAFGAYLDDGSIQQLVEFITALDGSGVRTFENERPFANAENGRLVYEEPSPGNCITCHGADGKLQAAPIDEIARNNEPEFLHKVRFGHPGSLMIPTAGGFEGLSPKDAVDVMAFVQTMSGGSETGTGSYETASLVRGGRLFDKWWEEKAASGGESTPPSVTNPLWDRRNPGVADLPAFKKASDSWRCISCHSWDYQGIGFAGGTPSATGPDNLLYQINLQKSQLTTQALQDFLFLWIKEGANSDLHAFSAKNTLLHTSLSDRDIWDLVKFLLEGMVDTNTYISQVFKTVKGAYRDLPTGEGLYFGSIDSAINCASCHGDDGMGIIGTATYGVDIFSLAAENPWEFLHKVRFGQPNAPMPAFLDPSKNHSTIHGVNVLDYAQTQFKKR